LKRFSGRIRNARSDSAQVLDCDVATARQVATLRGARLVGVWVSLPSLDALEARLTRKEAAAALRAEGDGGDGGGDAAAIGERVARTVSARLATVVDDIDFGVRSPMFEFTVIADGSEDAGAAKLAKAAAYVFAPY
jgi:hypothetical protein